MFMFQVNEVLYSVTEKTVSVPQQQRNASKHTGKKENHIVQVTRQQK